MHLFLRAGLSGTMFPNYAVIVFSLFFTIETACASEGILLLGDDPIRAGRAGAAVASPADASWVAFNPAGLVELERRLDLGGTIVYAQAKLRTKGLAKTPFIGEIEDNELKAVPAFGLVWPLEVGTLGVGLATPTGASIHFPQPRSWVGLLEGNTDRNLDFMQPRLTLAYAYRFPSGWALGVSVNGSLSMGRTDQLTPRLLATQGKNEWDYALGAGVGVSVYRRWERWSFAVAYESRQWAQTFDKYRDVSPFPTDLPATLQAGVAFRPVSSVEIEVDYRFINWSDSKFFHETNSHYGLGWNDQYGVMFGIEWTANPKWTFRAGYSHMSRAVTDEHVFGTVLAPLMVTDHVASGLTYTIGDRVEISFSLAHFFKGRYTESGNGDLYSHLGKGSHVSLSGEWISMNYAWKF